MPGGGGLRKKIEGGGMQERGKEDKMRGGGVRKKSWGGGMPERVKKTKCGGGGVVAKNNLRGYAGEGKEDKMRVECCEKKLRGVCRRGVKKTKCGGGVAKKIWGDIPQRG